MNIFTVSMDLSFKIPSAYFFVHAPTADLQVNLVKESLIRHHNSNIDIVMLTFDGQTTNL